MSWRTSTASNFFSFVVNIKFENSTISSKESSHSFFLSIVTTLLVGKLQLGWSVASTEENTVRTFTVFWVKWSKKVRRNPTLSVGCGDLRLANRKSITDLQATREANKLRIYQNRYSRGERWMIYGFCTMFPYRYPFCASHVQAVAKVIYCYGPGTKVSMELSLK